jgi:heat-inducible transcriptional repressor
VLKNSSQKNPFPVESEIVEKMKGCNFVTQRVSAPKRAGRKDRERKILISLVEYYLRTGKPVGSHTLQETENSDLSSATIRNYFVSLEQAGYLTQQHISGGRIPQAKAFVEYASYCLDELSQEPATHDSPLPIDENIDTDAVVSILQQTAHSLSQKANLATAISSPRFDHDVVKEITFVFIDTNRTLAVIITEFGLVHTHTISPPFTITPTLLRKADRFARARLFQETIESDSFEPEELDQVRTIYQEAIASYFVRYSSVSQEDLWRAGFSRLLQCPDFDASNSLTAPLSLFENTTAIRALMRETVRSATLKFWIGEALLPHIIGTPNCAFLAVPYLIGSRPVGAIAVIGPMRLLYRDVFKLLRSVSLQLSRTLSRCFVHHRISYRNRESHTVFLQDDQRLALEFHKNPQPISIQL